MSMESRGQDLLKQRLDECLRKYAADVMEPRDKAGNPFIQNIYLLQGMAEVHYMLKAEHPFTPQEVNALMKFENPLAVAYACWEENEDRYAFDICALIEKHQMEKSFRLADPSMSHEEPLSLREQLQAAMKESRRQLRPEQPAKGSRGGDAI